MKKLLLIILVAYSAVCFGQTNSESKRDNLPFDNHLLNDSKSDHSIDFHLQIPTLFNTSPNNSLKLTDYSSANNDVNFPTIFKNTFSPALNLEGNLYKQIYFNSRNWINTTRIQEEFIGLGGMNLYGANYNWKIGDFMIVSPGIYASKYNIYNNFRNDVGVNGKIQFVFSDHISMNLFGQYSVYGQKNSVIPLMTSMFPQTNFGGSFEFKVNDKWGIMVGTDREFDFRLKKWILKPFIMPLFYKF